SYSIAAPAAEFPSELMEAYHELLEPVLEAFDRLGLAVDFVEAARPAVYQPACYLRELNPAHDLAVDGRKISGNAQYRQRDAVIQHGSVMFDLAVDPHLGVFADPPEPSTFTEHVTSIRSETDVPREEVVATFEDALADWCGAAEGQWSDAELAAARELAAEKYAADSWVRDREPAAQT
ncbi:MAG: biotin/lipoate A/B protein ligase family protein, partial [Halobacteriales archaeon]